MQIDTGYFRQGRLGHDDAKAAETYIIQARTALWGLWKGALLMQMAGVFSEAMEGEALTASLPHYCFFPDLTTQEVEVRFRWAKTGRHSIKHELTRMSLICRNGTNPKVLFGIYTAFPKCISKRVFRMPWTQRNKAQQPFSYLIKKQISGVANRWITGTAGNAALSYIKSGELSPHLWLLATCRFGARCWGCQDSGATKTRVLSSWSS